jgi:leucyl aminopeptidase (aminopeptidase T)
MQADWQMVAKRLVQGLEVQPGELVQIVCATDRLDVLQEVTLAVSIAGATPLVEFLGHEYRRRLLRDTPTEFLSAWDKHRQAWMQQIDKILVLQGGDFKATDIAPEKLTVWRQATDRLTEAEEARLIPNLIASVPGTEAANQMGISLEKLEQIVLPALNTGIEELQSEINAKLAIAKNGKILKVLSGANRQYELRLQLADDRPWLSDDGYIDADDRARGAIVSNLPAGSIYTTVIEDATQGEIWLPQAGAARDVVFRFAGGRVAEITAAEGSEKLAAQLDAHNGEPRRVSHIGIGLNPHLHEPIGWILVDEHVYGYVFLALGENRYMGGQNESSLNVDYVIPGAAVYIDEQLLMSND